MNQDYLPTATIANLRKRADLICQIRSFFEDRDFFHVETPILSHDIVVDRYLHPVSVNKNLVVPTENSQDELFLQTSPEFGMKRLLAAGADSIYQITKVFRSSECGARHNPEFTMLEWYRVGDDLQAGMKLLAEFASHILNRKPTRLVSYAEIFAENLGINPHTATVGQLSNIATQKGINIASLDTTEVNRDEWLNLLLSHLIEPKLGWDHPVVIFDWPATQSALAIIRDDDPSVAERFELYVDGVELANGYHELLDANELLTRNKETNRLRSIDGSIELPEDSRLLAAMHAGLPACAGVALGVDRLVMIALGAQSINDVISFPIQIA